MRAERRRVAATAVASLLSVVAAACGSTVQTNGSHTLGTSDAAGLSAPSTASSTASGVGQQPGTGISGPGGSPPTTSSGNLTASAGATSATGGGPAAPAPTSGPIRVGFIYANNDAATAAGVDNNMTVTAGKTMKALVTSYNARGGFAGRKIQAFYQHLNSSSNDYETDYAAACAAFTQDDHVSVVVSAVGLYSESFQGCLAKARIPVVSDLGPDVQDAKQFPLMVTPDDLLADTRVVQVVERLKASGWLTPQNKIGVVIEDCPIDNRIFTNSLKPAIARAGLHLAATANPHCFQAIGDLGTISGQMGSAVINFRSAGVDRVMFVSLGEEGTMCFEFMVAAGQQNWYPGYAMSSMTYATTVATQSGIKQQEIENSRGVGWNPYTDTDDTSQAPLPPAGRDCVARLGKAGVRPTTSNDFFAALGVCDQFSLLDRIVRASGGDVAPGGFLRGLASAQQGFPSAIDVAGRTSTWDRGRLGPGAYRYFAWNTAKGGFAYTSNPAAF